jgi:sigma-B regulation protein RsbU (phosphoserine phosphatase)
MAKGNFPQKLHPSGSLARRVLLVCLCLLVVPLFLHTFLLYQQEYRQRIEDAEGLLRMIGEGEKELLEEIIEAEWQILETVSKDVSEHSKDLQIFVLPLPNGVRGRFALPSEKREALIVGIETSGRRAFAMAIPYQNILRRLSAFEKTPFPISLAIVSQDGKILAGSRQSDALSVDFPIETARISLSLTASRGTIQGLHERDVFFRFLSLLLFVGLIGGLFVWLLTRRVAKPLKQLCAAMQRVSEGAVHIRYTPDRMGFEINELGKQFNQTLDSLLRQQQEAERERIGREKLAQELRIGHEIQASLLPTHVPELPEIDIAPGFLPAREVGGDFYDLFLLENGSLFIAIADTAGKGISACLYSLGLRSSLRSFAAVSPDLSEIVLRANDLFWLDAKNSGMFVTLWAALYDPKTRALTYCSQGHAPSLLLRSGKIQELTTKGIALGAQKLDSIAVHSITLEVHDLVLLYTDGLLEAHDPDQQLFGSKRLREFLSRNGKYPPAQIIETLLEEIHLFGQGAPQHDDLTALALRISR